MVKDESALDSRNLLLFGCDFFPVRKASEINFWNDMVENSVECFDNIVVLSVNNRRVKAEKLRDNVYLYNVKPHYIGNTMRWSDPEYSGHRFHKLPLSAVYKTWSFLRYLPIFDDIIQEHNIGIVHYMRVFGLLNQLLTRRYPGMLFTVTVPTHIDRGGTLHPIYHRIKNMGLQSMDKVIATSLATKKRLQRLGISNEKLEVIHWSSSLDTELEFGATTDDIKSRLDFPSSAQVVLWSGPLQHTGPADFYYALEIAENVCQSSDRYLFVFAFKPDKLKPSYWDAVSNVDRIKVIETDRGEFSKLITITDVFLSPVCNKNRTVAPPITWIEMMRLGIPVVTTDVDGVSELITHNVSGFIVDGVENTVRLFLNLGESDTKRIGMECIKKVKREYDLSDISARYLTMWKEGWREKQHRKKVDLSGGTI